MIKISIVVFFLFTVFLFNGTSASSLKSPSTSALLGVKELLKVYKERNNGSFPDNWDDFVESGVLSGEVLESARRYCDIENRYFFPEFENVLEIAGRRERIIVMAKQPGGEGNQPESSDSAQIEGRWLIVETENGQIETRRYSEKSLELWFKKSGLDLSKYTLEAPPPKVSGGPGHGHSNGLPIGGPPGAKESIRPDLPSRKNLRAPDTVEKRDSRIWIPYLIFGLLVALIVVIKIIRNVSA